MRIRTFKSKATVLSWKRVDFPLLVGKFRYSRVFFTSEVGCDRRLNRSVVGKRELCISAVAERMRLQKPKAEISFVLGSLTDRVR